MTLEQLVERCKGSVAITVNEHRDMYMTVDEWIRDRARRDESTLDPEEVAELRGASTVYELHFYLDTPTAFYRCYGNSLESALARAAKCLEANDATTP
jgi:hypothetical protein